jgi:zinc protease
MMPYSIRSRRVLVAIATALSTAAPLAAQRGGQATTPQPRALDRRVAPTPGKTPELRVPAWSKSTLSNGARLIVSEKHGLPLVSFQINFVGGANQYEPAGKTGLAGLTASMLSEGTRYRTGDEISNALQLLGTSINTSIGGESGRISFLSTTDKLAPTLAILADILRESTYPEDALERLKARTVVTLTQNRDRTAGIAAVVFPKVVYTTEHPYGTSPTEATVKSVTREDVVSFAKSYFQPRHAVITVVGDVTEGQVKQLVERVLGTAWVAGGSMPSFNYPSAPQPKSTTIFLVDKPGAAQSTFAIGEVGPPRDTPDYYALRVMNEMLGVLFQSRLNHNIREVKGYSYGVFSNYAFGRGPGAFRAGGDVVTAKTDSALIEFMKELRDIRGPRPPTDEEMAQAKASLVQSLPAMFASVSSVNNSIGTIYTQDLPEDYYQQFAKAVNAVTKNDVVRVAEKYIDPDHLAIVIVGDRATIAEPLAATKIAPIVLLDLDGNLIQGKTTP